MVAVNRRTTVGGSGPDLWSGAFNGGADAVAAGGATGGDFFGDGLEGNASTNTTGAAPVSTYTPGDIAAKRGLTDDATTNANININSDRNASQSSSPEQQAEAAAAGNIGGAAGAYNTGSDEGRAGYDWMHDVTRDPGLNAVDWLEDNTLGTVGLDDFGDAVNGISSAGGAAVDTITGGDGFQGVVDNINAAGKSAGEGDLAGVINGVTGLDIPSMEIPGAGGGDTGPSFDTSGADRGGSARDYTGDLSRVQGKADATRALGRDVLSGNVAGPNAADAARQGDALDQVMGFAGGPKAANDVMGKVSAFGAQPEGPSKAQLLMDEAQQRAMSDVLSASRSGRARDAGSQARASNVAQAEIAGMGVDNARNAGLLRADEADKFRTQQLSALGLEGNIAQGLDSNTLEALATGGNIAGQMRTAGIGERGQGLNFMQGMEGIGAGMETDALKTIPQFEQVRHGDQFELTPQQQLAAAKMGGPRDPTTTDYIMNLLGDLLPNAG